jgi:predicted house-cleaning NTP pyrophosphatase (Maf/HAM1 superfamily)
MENELENSENYLKSVASRALGFSLPDGYFDAIENRFSSLLSEEKIPKNIAFKIPENYFESLEKEVFAKVLSSERKVKVISLSQRVFKYTFIVAAAAVLFFTGITYLGNTNTTEITFDNLADNEIKKWLLENSAIFTTPDISMVFTEKELIENDFSFTNINDEAIEDYIISTDNSSILNEID